MSIRERIVGPCVRKDEATGAIAIAGDLFLERLLLFEHSTLETYGLLELPSLIALFGYDGLAALLNSGALSLHANRLMSGSFERESATKQGMRFVLDFTPDTPVTEPMVYRIYNAMQGKPSEELQYCVEAVDNLALPSGKATKLVDAIMARVVDLPPSFGRRAIAQTNDELTRDSGPLRTALAIVLSRSGGVDVLPNDLQLTVQRDDDAALHAGQAALRVQSNLTSRLGLSRDSAHRMIGNSLLALSRLNGRIETMEVCSAVSGTQPDDSEFMASKLRSLAREVVPESQHDRFERLVTIVDLPRLDVAMRDGKLKAERFLKVRRSRECQEFRRWLRDLDDASEKEIVDRVASVRAKFGNAAGSRPGRIARFLATFGIGVLTPPGGFAAGALDTFILDKLLPTSGPASFLSKQYPSLFEKR